MQILSLAIRNFRNLKNININNLGRINIFVGKNASGKTNLLEALYFLGNLSSFRLYTKSQDLIKFGEEGFYIKANLKKNDIKEELKIKFKKDTKILKINDKSQKASEFLQHLSLVIFSTDDFQLIKGPPIYRRKFMNNLISQVNPTYYNNLIKFYKILKQRNIALATNNQEIINVWDEQFKEVATYIIQQRKNLINSLSAYINQEKEDLSLKYIPSVEPSSLIYKLKEIKPMEIKKKKTLIGPHRDDLIFYKNGFKLSTFGSQSQIRTALLSLKLAQVEYIKNKLKKNPILLLDDIIQELDEIRKYAILNIIMNSESQIFMVTITKEDIKPMLNSNKKEEIRLFKIEKGEVELWQG